MCHEHVPRVILPVSARVCVTGHVYAVPVIPGFPLHVRRLNTMSPVVVVITFVNCPDYLHRSKYISLPDEPVFSVIISALIKNLFISSNDMQYVFVKILKKLPNSRRISSLYSACTRVYHWLLGQALNCKFQFDFPDRMMLLMMRILRYHCSILA